MTPFQAMDKVRGALAIRSITAREFLAEMLGTFVLVFLGDAAVAQVTLSGEATGNFLSINIGYATAVFLGVLVSGGVSGGHINPAVSLSMALVGKFPWTKVPIFMVAQYVGAFLGAVMVFLVYRDGLDTFDPDRTMSTAGIFATYPGTVVNSTGYPETDYLTSGNGMADQIVGTAILLLCVSAIGDPRNMGISKEHGPAAVAVTVLAVGISMGVNCGYAINPARDLSPRLFTLIAGWGAQTFEATTSDGVQWWWIPVLGPHIGGILGVLCYILLVELHHPKEDDSNLDLVVARKNSEQETNSNGHHGTYSKRSDHNGVSLQNIDQSSHQQSHPTGRHNKY